MCVVEFTVRYTVQVTLEALSALESFLTLEALSATKVFFNP